MKILLSESQLKTIIEAVKLDPEVVKQRFKEYKKIAIKYPNPRQLNLFHPKIYAFLRSQGLMDQVFQNRKKYHPEGYWTAETVSQESSKYNSKSEFQSKNQFAYNKAIELGILNYLFPMNNVGRDKIWTLEKSIQTAKEFNGTRSQFLKKYPSAWKSLRDNEKLWLLGKSQSGSPIDINILIDQAKKYKNRSSLRNENPILYNKLVIRGILFDVFPKVNLTDDEIIEKSKKYSSPSELNFFDQNLYLKLKKIPNGYNRAFGEDYKYRKLIDIAKGYSSKHALFKDDRYTYNTLSRLGLLNKVYNVDEPIEKLSLSNSFNDIDKTEPIKTTKTNKKIKNLGPFKSIEDLKSVAMKYNNVNQLKIGDPNAYIILRNNNMLDDLFADK
jgi:hypothetical protein